MRQRNKNASKNQKCVKDPGMRRDPEMRQGSRNAPMCQNHPPIKNRILVTTPLIFLFLPGFLKSMHKNLATENTWLAKCGLNNLNFSDCSCSVGASFGRERNTSESSILRTMSGNKIEKIFFWVKKKLNLRKKARQK